MPNTLNAATLALNGASEACLLMPYDDARPSYALKLGDKVLGTLTQGWGHTGSGIKIGVAWTQEHADQVRQADLQKAANVVAAAVRVPLSDNQYGVLTDFTFNIGTTEFLSSTLLKKLNTGDYASVADQLPRWVYSTVNRKKVKMQGLIERRQREAFLWTVPDAKTEQAVSAFMPATQPSTTAAPIPQKTLATSATVLLIGAGTALNYAGPELSSAAASLQPFADVAPFMPALCKYLGLTGVVCGLLNKARNLRQQNAMQAT